MKKERIFISCLMIALATLILMTGFFGRIDYEQKSRYAFVATDMNDLKAHGLNTPEYCARLKDVGSHVVTVHPLTLKGLQESGRLNLISYSSLSINTDVISQQISEALGSYPMRPENLIAVVTDPDLQNFLERELSYRYTDYTQVVLEDGTTKAFAFQNLTQKNDLIVGYDSSELNFISSMGMKVAIIYPSYTFEHPSYSKFFKEFVIGNGVSFLLLRDNPYDNQLPMPEDMKAALRNLDLTLVFLENENQIGNEQPYLSDDFFSVMKFNTIRSFYMDKIIPYDSTMYRYRYHQWFNSAIERNTVFIHADIAKNPNVSAEENADLTLRAVSDFTRNMRGYEISDHRPEIPYLYGEETMAMAGGILLLSLLYLYLLFVLKKVPPYFTEGYFGLMIVTSIFAYAFAPHLTNFFAVGIMIAASSLISTMMFYLDKRIAGRKKLLWILLSTFAIVVCAIIGISALLGGIEYYVSYKWFHGVVISLTVPLVMAFVNGYLIYYSQQIPLKKIPELIRNQEKKISRWVLLLIATFGIFFLVYYFVRSGKSDLILPAEDHFRKWLSDTFYIRPRLKEFLFGYPAFSVFLFLSVKHKQTEWRYFFGVCASLLFTSLFNTFCHTFTAVSVSVHRVFNGLLCGLMISVAMWGVILLVKYLMKKSKQTKESNVSEQESEQQKAEEVQTEDSNEQPEIEKAVLQSEHVDSSDTLVVEESASEKTEVVAKNTSEKKGKNSSKYHYRGNKPQKKKKKHKKR